MRRQSINPSAWPRRIRADGRQTQSLPQASRRVSGHLDPKRSLRNKTLKWHMTRCMGHIRQCARGRTGSSHNDPVFGRWHHVSHDWHASRGVRYIAQVIGSRPPPFATYSVLMIYPALATQIMHHILASSDEKNIKAGSARPKSSPMHRHQHWRPCRQPPSRFR